MTDKKHDPENLVFTSPPNPPNKNPKVYGIWQLFKENFKCDPDVVYYSYDRQLWVVEIAGTEHTVQ
jgi:hypothetical protein